MELSSEAKKEVAFASMDRANSIREEGEHEELADVLHFYGRKLLEESREVEDASTFERKGSLHPGLVEE